MNNKARLATLLTVLICCAACSAPSLRYKKEINKALAAGQFETAQQRLDKSKQSEYGKKDRLLYYLDSATILHDAGREADSDILFAKAQDRIDELFTQSISAHTGQFLLNDLTVPYQPATYERALTYYYRAMNFLSLGNIPDALVEANRAVYYLGQLRASKTASGKDNPFVQYFMSLVFESAGKRDDARIARTRAQQAYAALAGKSGLPQEASFPPPVKGWGEVILVHANGKIPLKKSATFQVAWGDVLTWLHSSAETDRRPNPEVENAIVAGMMGSAITVAYPVLEIQPYAITSSEVLTQQGTTHPTLLMADLAAAAQADLKERESGTLFRMALRAAAKRTAAVQARHIMNKNSKDQVSGELAEMFISFLGALTEKADTRQWFTLPAQLRMARFYVPPGKQDITLRLRNGFGKIVGEYTFHDVVIPADGRVYLHCRTAK